MRVLCTADIHIGRNSSGDGEIHGEVSALAAWERIVAVAIQDRADAVVIAGDLFDSLAAQYATRRAVRRAFERLREKNIPAVAVAGNHDHSALPIFAQSHPGLFHLFGSSAWSEHRIGNLRFVGRSFGGEFATESLLANYDLSAGDLPTVGVVHADIDAQSQYGPTSLNEFGGRGVAAWVVGHVHSPRNYSPKQPVAYPGSPQALDWGETGVHGFRWLTLERGRAEFSEVMPLSTVRYEYATVELDAGESLDLALTSRSADYRRDHGLLSSVQFRVDVRLINGCECPAFPREATTLDRDCYFVRSRVAVPNIDLATEARLVDARGQAARLLLGLKGEGDPVWRDRAMALVQSVGNSIDSERRKLNLPAGEELDSLRHGTPDEALNSVRRVLENVLTADGRGQ